MTSVNYTEKNLTGSNAFYDRIDYEGTTKADFARNEALPAVYKCEIEHKIVRVAKYVFAIIIFPIGIYYVIHAVVGHIVVPSSLVDLGKTTLTRSQTDLDGEWSYKRITIEVDGYNIDAMIVGKRDTFGNGRWVLGSNGNGELYEYKIYYDNSEYKKILEKTGSNGIIFNYPGVGSSTGRVSRSAMEKAYRAMLQFLEDDKIGIGAKEIIGYGHSIGGGSQGDALRSHKLKNGIKYVFVKSRTFSNLQAAISTIIGRPVGFLAKVFGWNMDSVQSSKTLKAPEIILQTASVSEAEELKDSSKIIDDGIIYAKASHAKVLLDDPKVIKSKKVFIGLKEDHNETLLYTSVRFLAKKINESMAVA